MLFEHPWLVWPGLACIPLYAALTLWIVWLTARTLDLVAPAAERAPLQALGLAGVLLVVSCALLLASAVAEAGIRYLMRTTLINASRLVEERLKNDLMAHLGRLPIAWFDRARTGDLISRLTQDVELLRFMIGPAVMWGGTALLLVPAVLWRMSHLSPLLTLAAGVAFALLLASLALLMPRLQKHGLAVQEAIGEISQRAQEDFGGIRVLMNFARTTAEAVTMRNLSQAYLQKNLGLTRLRARLDLLIAICRDLVVLGIIVLGALEAIAGHITAAGLFEFWLLMNALV